jgi:hypothetical protein
LRKDTLEILSSTLIKNPAIVLVYSDQYYSNIPNQTFDEVSLSKKPKLYSFPDYNYFHQLDRCLVCSQPMWRASLHFEDEIWFDEKYEICGDYEFNLKITQKYKMLHIPKPLGVFYSSLDNENKSYKYNAIGVDEMKEMSETYIMNYINTTSNVVLNKAVKRFEKHIRFAIPLYYLWRRICLFFKPELIKGKFFHSVEFMYYFTIIYLVNNNRRNKAIRLSRKFLRYGKSVRINNRLENLLKKEF